MEVRRSNLTMGTCFSVTGIEERIKVMKNRKHQGILSIALAFAIFLGATLGAMTGIPMAGAENAAPRMIFSRKTWEGTYAKYGVYGLGYDGKNGTITYNGQVVRYFEDMWPIDETSKSGACFVYEGGTVDVYGVREFPEIIRRNPDGTFDPSGTLVGLRQATQEEYDAMTAWLEGGTVSQTTMVMQATEGTAYVMADTTPSPAMVTSTAVLMASATLMPTDDPAATPAPVAYTTLDPASPFVSSLPYADVEWWTAEEYRAWMEAERTALQQLVDEQARAWTPSKGWFVWTQEEADAAMARYENILRAIEQGALVSKPVNGQDVAFVSGVSETVVINAEEALSADSVSDSVEVAYMGIDNDSQIIWYGMSDYALYTYTHR